MGHLLVWNQAWIENWIIFSFLGDKVTYPGPDTNVVFPMGFHIVSKKNIVLFNQYSFFNSNICGVVILN